MICVEFPESAPKMGIIPQSRLTQVLLLGLVLLLLPASLFAAAPIIDSFTASSTTVAPGGTISLQVDAHDPDCATPPCTSGCGTTIRADLTTWSATGGGFANEQDGVTGSPYTAAADWVAPATEAVYTVDLSISDSATSFCGGGRQTTTDSIQIQVTLTPNLAPVIDTLTASAVRIFPVDTADLHCSASDPDGDPLSYSWSSDHGTVIPGAGGDALYDPGTPGLATITCTATDANGAPASANVQVSATDALPERRIGDELGAPLRLDVDAWGDVYVADPSSGGLTVLALGTGEVVYHVPLPGVSSVAVDWAGDLLAGTVDGARVVDRDGRTLLDLDPGIALGPVSDVAVDKLNLRYVVLHRDTARVVVYGAGGQVVSAFGANGDGPAEMRIPQGVAVDPAGRIVVADSGHGEIKVFNLAGTLQNAFGTLGSSAGEYVRLGDVEVDGDGVIYTTDAFQDWIQTWNPTGTPRETLGTYGTDLGQLRTPTGVAVDPVFHKLVVASQNGGRLEVFRLAGTVPGSWPAPVAGLSASQLAFADQAVASTSGVLSVTVSNTGDAPLGILDTRTAGDFRTSSACGRHLDPGASCNLAVTFAPLAPGARAGTLSLRTSDGELTIALSGDGFTPATATVSAGALEFGTQAVGTMSAPRTVTLTNYGSVDLTISAIQPSTHFGVVSTCPGLLAPGASCSADVYFLPASTGDPLTGTLSFNTSAPGDPVVALSGRSLLLRIAADRSEIRFGFTAPGATSAPRAVLVTNTGDGAVILGTVAIGGPDWSEFEIWNDGCSNVQLAAAASCTFDVVFSPDSESLFAAEVLVPSSAPETPAIALSAGDVALFLDGFESGDTSAWSFTTKALAKTVAFGRLLAGESAARTLTWSNSLSEAVALGELSILGAVHEKSYESFWIEDDGCSYVQLGPRQTCSVKVHFAPREEGGFQMKLYLPSDKEGALAPESFDLRGAATIHDTTEESER